MKQLLRVMIIFLAAFFVLFLVARLHGKELSQSQAKTQSQISPQKIRAQ